MKVLPPSPTRAIMGLLAFIAIFCGAYLLWGAGGAFFAFGLVIWADVASDEALERITEKKRGFQR